MSARKQKALLKALAETALAVRREAYAPYSGYLVGAAILTPRGCIYAGCNVECADYDGTHAEEAALAAMVAAGERSPAYLVCFGGLEGQEPSAGPPCGKCRQKLAEFASLSGIDLLVSVGRAAGGQLSFRRLSELLPSAFGPAEIGIDLVKHRR